MQYYRFHDKIRFVPDFEDAELAALELLQRKMRAEEEDGGGKV